MHRIIVNVILFILILAACSLPSQDCTRPEVFCVGLVTDFGSVDEPGFNQSAWTAVEQAKAEGLVDRIAFIETIDVRDRSKNVTTLAEEGYDLIITIGYSMRKATKEAAAEFKSVHFIGVDQPQDNKRDNLTGLVFPEDQGGFLAGALAASVTVTGRVAAVCDSQSVAEMWEYCEGFREGAYYVNPDLRIFVVYHNDNSPSGLFNDPDWGAETALSLVEDGVDVLFAAGGETGRGALQAAAESGVYVIGADADMYYQLDGVEAQVLSSATKDVTGGLYALIRFAAQGQLEGGEFDGAFSLAPNHALETAVSPEVRARLEEIRIGLANATLRSNVPSIP
ncbi:MAG: BMP family ABC transporter substrate-binding protein [Chloroflexota bacterium]